MLPPVGPDLRLWGENLTRYLRQSANKLRHLRGDETPAQNGAILWDDAAGYPVVAKDGEFKQIVLADGYAFFVQDNDVTAAMADTAYAITFDAAQIGEGVALGTPASRIVFDEAGKYLLAFSADIVSSKASTVEFYFWPRVNGTDVPNGSIRANLHQNGAAFVVSRSVIFDVAAGDYLEAMWAVSDTNGSLQASAATAFAPSSPAASLSVARLRA